MLYPAPHIKGYQVLPHTVHSDSHRSFEVLFKSDRKEFTALILSELAPLANFEALPSATKSFLKRLDLTKSMLKALLFGHIFVFSVFMSMQR
jgi:hypothetical protein